MAELYGGKYVPADLAKLKFLEAFMECGRIGEACKQIGMVTRTFYHWKANDPEFLANFQLADAMLLSALEDEAWRRGVAGVEVPVYQGGALVGVKTEYSDMLLAMLLKARASHKYGKGQGNGDYDEAGRLKNGAAEIVHVHSSVPLANSESQVIREIDKGYTEFEMLPQVDEHGLVIDELMGNTDNLNDV